MKKERKRKKEEIETGKKYNIISPYEYAKPQLREPNDGYGYTFEEAKERIILNLQAQIDFYKNMTEKDFLYYG